MIGNSETYRLRVLQKKSCITASYHQRTIDAKSQQDIDAPLPFSDVLHETNVIFIIQRGIPDCKLTNATDALQG